MKTWLNRIRIGWLIIVASAATLGIVISLLVLGGPERDFTATAYSDVIRFQAEGVATLQVRIFDLSGKEVWDSGMVSGDIVDWDRRNDTGERLAYGAYIYSAQGWNASGDLNFQKNGKLALMPGDTVQLQAAPAVESATNFRQDNLSPEGLIQPQAVYNEDVTINGKLTVNGCAFVSSGNSMSFGLGPSSDAYPMAMNCYVIPGVGWYYLADGKAALIASILGDIEFYTASEGIAGQSINWFTEPHPNPVVTVTNHGTLGIGTRNATATLEVHGSATNLLALYDPVAPTDPKFRVEKTGTVRADGAYYSGAGGFHQDTLM